MNQLPNNHTPKGQPHTIMESPLWMARLYTFPSTFWLTWVVMIPINFLFPWGNLWTLFMSSFPLLLAILIDKKFTQQFLMPEWNRSTQDDEMMIRGVSYKKIREWIEWHIQIRTKTMLCIGGSHVVLTIFSDNEVYLEYMMYIFIAAILISNLIRTWLGFKKFGFMSWYFSDIVTFRSPHSS